MGSPFFMSMRDRPIPAHADDDVWMSKWKKSGLTALGAEPWDTDPRMDGIGFLHRRMPRLPAVSRLMQNL